MLEITADDLAGIELPPDSIPTPDPNKQIDSLIEQLKNTRAVMNQPLPEIPTLKPEDAEGFIIKKMGELVTESLDLVRKLKNETIAAADAEGIEALSKLIAATASAGEALNKIVVTEKKGKIMKEVKEMEIKAKLVIDEKIDPSQLTLKGTREEIFKQLLKEADVIEITEQRELKQLSSGPGSAAPCSSEGQPVPTTPQ